MLFCRYVMYLICLRTMTFDFIVALFFFFWWSD